MKQHSRTLNTIYNFTSSVGGQVITILMHFVVRTFFINTLGKSYLGISGLFSNILSMLSLAEFGVGSAILFKLYEPIAHDDYHRITVLMKFYKTAYRVIGCAVALIGVCLIPFLPILIGDYHKLEALHINAILIFLLYLLKSVSSYFFFAYKSAFVKANQKEYLLNILQYLFTLLASVAQIITLVLFHNFILYVLILVLQVITYNIACAVLADRMYPVIREKTTDSLDKTEIKDIFKDCSALFLYKLNNVVLKATDNIVLSMFMGLDMVALYSNYYVFYTTLQTLFSKVYNAVAHSLGNLHTSHDVKHEYDIFEVFMFFSAILGGTAGLGIWICSDEVVRVWLGSDWEIPHPFSLLMGLEVFTMAVRYALGRYRTSLGLFQQAKYRPVFGMVINLVVSVLLVRFWGICGVLVGTLVADWSTYMWFDPIIIHKYGFENYAPVFRYYKKILKYLLTLIFIGILDYLICTSVFLGHGWFSPIFHAAIICISSPLALTLVSLHTAEGQYFLNMIRRETKIIRRKLSGH